MNYHDINRTERVFYFVIAFVVVLIVFFAVVMIYSEKESRRERAEWRAFKEAHACKLIEKTERISVSGGGGIGMTSDGKAAFVTGGDQSIPATVTYICNDGVKYKREASSD